MNISMNEVVRITGVNPNTLRMLYAKGSIGKLGYFSEMEVLGIAVGRGLRATGVGCDDAGNVMDYFMTLTRERLEANFEREAKYLMIVGNRCVPRLMTKEAITDNPQVDLTAASALYLAALSPRLVDVYLIWTRLLDEIQPRPTRKIRPVRVTD